MPQVLESGLKRDHTIGVRLDDDELGYIAQAAKSERVSEAAFLRSAGLEVAAKLLVTDPPPTLRERMRKVLSDAKS
jgi:uncharacterized protein (DUF1778 family)